MLRVKQGGIKYHFLVFGMARLWIEPRSPGPLANTLTIMPIYINRNENLFFFKFLSKNGKNAQYWPAEKDKAKNKSSFTQSSFMAVQPPSNIGVIALSIR